MSSALNPNRMRKLVHGFTAHHRRIQLLHLLAFHRGMPLLGLLVVTQASAVAQQNLQPGVVLPKIITAEHPGQSYALYLPSNYSSAKKWPIVYAFDPAARGRIPVDLMKHAAEKFGYIVAGSNNSRNGSAKIESDAAEAVFQDTRSRLAVDDTRIYIAGFSGGARLAAELAQHCKCAAGVIIAGAAFQPDPHTSPESFAVFSAIGSFDFNYGEMVALDETLEKLHAPHFLRRFEGPHQWPPPAVLEEALAWLGLQAIKTGREPRDAGFIAAQVAIETTRAQSFESANPFAAWFEYRQAAETFDTLADVSQFRAKQKSLEGQKSVLDAAKREKREIREQDELSNEILSGFSALIGKNDNSDNNTPAAGTRNEIREHILTLKTRADHEKNPDKARVMKRALAGILVSAMESGLARSEANDTARARDFFELAVAADPDSVWALTNLAVARAAANDKKGALEALRHTKEKWSDRSAFTEWLNSQSAFSKLRDTPDFRVLLQ